MAAAGNGRHLLRERAPVFAAELEALLRDAGEHELAASVNGVRIVQPCTCGDDFCASFYTIKRNKSKSGRSRRGSVEIEPAALYLDVSDGQIVQVEWIVTSAKPVVDAVFEGR